VAAKRGRQLVAGRSLTRLDDVGFDVRPFHSAILDPDQSAYFVAK
jgi:hypothetical protein